MKEYYNTKDIMQMTECSKALAYNILRRLREDFEREYPNKITIQGKIPIWYANERLGIKKEVLNND